jgi:hypothetical protein
MSGPLRIVSAVLFGLICIARAGADAASPPPAPVPSALPATATTAAVATPAATPTPLSTVTTSPLVSTPIQDPNVKPASATSYVPPQQPMVGEMANGYPPSDTQDAPGAKDYSSDSYGLSTRLPSYYFDPRYYNTPWVGARPFADYAPPGYEEEREVQDAPGNPVFVRTPPPTRLASGETNDFVTRGMMPGSFLVPGTNTSFRLRGFVRLAEFYDFDPIGSADSFVPNTIPVPQSEGQNFNMSGRISRFALESWTPTDYCDWNVHTMIEGDFFNGPAQAAGGGGNPFRLRNAFFDFGFFRFGQQNTVFMDGSNWPSLVDFQGPNGWINQRQPSARMTLPMSDRLYCAASMERPFSDITTSGLGTNVQDVPDFASHLRYETDLGHLQASALVRSIGYRPTDEEVTRLTGVGVSGSAVFHPWAILMGTDPVREENPSGLTRSRILLQYTWGPGTARYVNDLVGQGLDGQVNPITGDFNLVNSNGWNASYENWFNAHWLTNFTYSEARADNNAGQPATTYQQGKYLAGSLWWIPIARMSFGIEYMWGQRENLDGEDARARRLDGLFQYNF